MTIRGIGPELGNTIKTKASLEDLSVNQWILKALRQSAGLGDKRLFRKYDDLDSLAGGWSRQEAEEFLDTLRFFEEIDDEVWK